MSTYLSAAQVPLAANTGWRMSKLTRLFAISSKVVVPACTGILLSAQIFVLITICEGFALVSGCDSPSKCR